MLLSRIWDLGKADMREDFLQASFFSLAQIFGFLKTHSPVGGILKNSWNYEWAEIKEIPLKD